MNRRIFLSYGNLPMYALEFTTTEIYRKVQRPPPTPSPPPMAVTRVFPNDKFLGLYPAAFIRDCLTHSLLYFSLPFRRSVGSLPSLARRALPATQYFVALTLERGGTS